MSRIPKFTMLLVLAGALLLVSGAATASAASTYSVQISRAAFTPSTRYLAPGDTITWYNADSVNHQVASSFGFNSPVLTPGQSYSYTFASSGDFTYHDALYTGNKGEVIVQAQIPSGAIAIYSSGFKPSSQTVDTGATVTWYNADSASHQVVASDGSFTSPVLTQGQSYSRQFTSAGTFSYLDGFHPGHTGKITVQPPLPAPPPAGDIGIWSTGFTPSPKTAVAGQAVTWYNADRYNHQVVGDNNRFTSPVLAPGQSFSFTYANSGTYGYKDGLATSHRGTVIVQATLTLTSMPTSVVFGATATLSGVVSSGNSGETVQLYSTAPGSSTATTWLATTVSVAGGSYSFSVSPKQTSGYVTQWGKTLSPPLTLTVSPKMTFLPVKGTNYQTYELTVNGGSSYFSGKLFHIQGLYQGVWTNLSSTRVGPDGTKTFKRPNVKGVETFRLYMDATQAGPSFIAGNSGTQKLPYKSK